MVVNARVNEQDVKDAISMLKRLDSKFTSDFVKKEILAAPAKVVEQVAKANTPVHHEIVKRYKTSPYVSAGKKDSKVEAHYHPGNLKRSIKVLDFLNTKYLYIVGPEIARKTKGHFRNDKKVDGWYAHFVEYGTAHFSGSFFMRRAYEMTKRRVVRMITSKIQQIIYNYDKSGGRSI
jgi:HK97 gp10 family phage protein